MKFVRGLPLLGLLVLTSSCVLHLTRDDIFTFQSPVEADRPLREGWAIAHLPTRLGAAFLATQQRGSPPVATLLFFNGNGYSAREALERLLPRAESLHFDVVVFDYRREGEPAPSATGVRLAVAELVQLLTTSTSSSKRPLLAAGHSLGCWFALDVSRSPAVAAAVLLAPGTTVAEVGNSVLGAPLNVVLRLVSDEDASQLNAEQFARAAIAPVLVVGSKSDQVMPLTFQTRIDASLQRKRFVTLTDVKHSGYLRSDDVWNAMASFFATWLKAERSSLAE